MRKHTGGGSVNTCRIPQFRLAELANTCCKAKGRLAQLFFPNAGYDLGHPDSVNSKHSAFYPNTGMGDQYWNTWRTESAESPLTKKWRRQFGSGGRRVRAVGVATTTQLQLKNFFSVKKQRINAKSEPSKCSRLAISRRRQIYAMIGVELRTRGEIFVKS